MTAPVHPDAPETDARPTALDRFTARLRLDAAVARRVDVLAAIAVTFVAGLARLWQLGRPHSLVFDETYYVKDAWSQWVLGYPGTWPSGVDPKFADGQTGLFDATGSFVVHPPLGKWLIGLGMWLTGPDSSVGWRLAPALLGTATVLLVYLLGRRLTGSIPFATVAALLMAVDGTGIVLSRVALLDGILTFFIVLAVLLAVIDRDRHVRRMAWGDDTAGGLGRVVWNRPWLVAAGAAAGAATAVKWSGLYVLAAIGIWAVVSDALARRRAGRALWPWGALRQGGASFVLLVPVAAVVYLASWTGWLLTDGGYDRHAADAAPATGLWAWVPRGLQSLWIYHKAIYDFNVGLNTPHSYASPAWQWPLIWRPTSMYWHQDAAGQAGCRWASGCVQAISSIPNPLLWWAAMAAAVLLIVLYVRRRDRGHAVALIGLAATWLPWLAFPERTVFQFYTVAMLPFAALALAYALREIAGRGAPVGSGRRRTGQRAVWIVLGIIVALSAFWYPVWTGMPVPYTFWLVHNPIRTWI